MTEQTHPQENKDRLIVNRLLEAKMGNYELAELARLRIRYRDFPGARDIQEKLELLLQKWGLTEESLYEKTRQIHAQGKVYQRKHDNREEDWS